VTGWTDSFIGLLDGGLCLVHIDLDSELLFNGHQQLDNVERIGAEIVDQMSLRPHRRLLNPESLGHDLTDLGFDTFPKDVVASHS